MLKRIAVRSVVLAVALMVLLPIGASMRKKRVVAKMDTTTLADKMQDFGRTVSKETLCEAVWGTSDFIDENALQVNLTRLKKTLTGLSLPLTVDAERGVGYVLRKTEEKA